MTNLPENCSDNLSSNRGFLYGESIFTSGILLDGKIIFEAAHLCRLKLGISKIYAQIPDAEDIFAKLVDKFNASVSKMCGLYCFRITFFADSTNLLTPKNLFYHFTVEELPRDSFDCSALSIILAPAQMYFDSQLKMNRYGETFLVRRNLDHADDVLFYHHENYILEGSTSNVFFIKDNILITPEIERGVLEGVTRDFIIDHVDQLEMKIEIRKVHIEELGSFDNAFYTNAKKVIIPIAEIDQYKYKVDQSFMLKKKVLKILNIGE